MVNTINHKYIRISSKTDSRNFCKGKLTLINHFLNEKTNSYSIYTMNIF